MLDSEVTQTRRFPIQTRCWCSSSSSSTTFAKIAGFPSACARRSICNSPTFVFLAFPFSLNALFSMLIHMVPLPRCAFIFLLSFLTPSVLKGLVTGLVNSLSAKSQINQINPELNSQVYINMDKVPLRILRSFVFDDPCPMLQPWLRLTWPAWLAVTAE